MPPACAGTPKAGGPTTFASAKMRSLAARARVIHGARRKIEDAVGRRTMKKVRSDDPRFGKAVRSLSKSARTIADALDIPVNIRKELSCDEIRQICHALLEGLVAASQVSIGSEIRSIFGESKSDLGAQFRLG